MLGQCRYGLPSNKTGDYVEKWMEEIWRKFKSDTPQRRSSFFSN